MKPPKDRDCPADDELLAAFLVESDPAVRDRIDRHIAACSVCRRKRDVLDDIAGELRALSGHLPDRLGPGEIAALRKMAGTEVRRLRREGRPRRLFGVPARTTALASVLVMAAAAGVFYFLRMRAPDTERGSLAGVRLIEPSGPLEQAPAVFRWDSVPGADIYEFEIFDEELRPVLSRTTKATSVTLAPEETEKLGPGREYYWDVEAIDGHGRPISTGQKSFTIGPGGTPNEPGVKAH